MFLARYLPSRAIFSVCAEFMPVDPYVVLLKKLKKRGIRFVVIGVAGINYYADEAGSMFSTQDLDVLVEPDDKSILAALEILEKEGFRLESNGEPLGGLNAFLVGRIVERRTVVTARKGKDVRIDIVLNAGGFAFRDWDKTRRMFKVGRTLIPVGSLSQLVRAKENSNREKDRAFLALYKIQLKEMLRRAAREKLKTHEVCS